MENYIEESKTLLETNTTMLQDSLKKSRKIEATIKNVSDSMLKIKQEMSDIEKPIKKSVNADKSKYPNADKRADGIEELLLANKGWVSLEKRLKKAVDVKYDSEVELRKLRDDIRIVGETSENRRAILNAMPS